MEHISDKLKAEFSRAKNAFLEADRICIISHRGPDGDAVGSNCALKLALQAMGKEVVSACVDPVPPDSVWLKGADKYVEDFSYNDFDLVCSVDCAAPKMVVFEIKHDKPFVNFDHHISNNGFGTVNVVDADACSTAIILYKFLEYCGWRISIDIATCLLHGIYFDTGSLMHSNTTEEVYRVAGELMSRGANLKKIAKEPFHTTAVNKMRLWGRILERTYVNEQGVTVSAVGTADYVACGATSKDTGGAIDFLNAVPGSQYCVLLSEDDKGLVKGSLRTQREDVNLSDVAGQWGGGGHPKASGFGIEGHLRPVMSWKIVGENGEGKELTF
ncbi:DHH family phosphoesterase [Candidatus Gracilibacteria bacterium]|nr:DHH family phosphoesterase [Candidatus Gracilibacteria bacterium]